MSTSIRKQKGSWRDAFGNLASKAYFESCQHPPSFNYPDFLAWSKGRLTGKAKIRQEWANARTLFRKSRHQSLRDAAVKLDKAWELSLDEEYETDFFRQQQDLRRLLNGRRPVHAAADRVIIKRQRVEFEEEGRSLDDKLHSGKCLMVDVPALCPVFELLFNFAVVLRADRGQQWLCGRGLDSRAEHCSRADTR